MYIATGQMYAATGWMYIATGQMYVATGWMYIATGQLYDLMSDKYITVAKGPSIYSIITPVIIIQKTQKMYCRFSH